MGTLRHVTRFLQGAAGIGGYALAAWFTLFPANDAQERQDDFRLVLWFCVVAVVLFYARTREARKNIKRFRPQFNFAKSSELPVTVTRMAKLAQELKRAASELPNDIAPAPART